jgi:hypothetical protein
LRKKAATAVNTFVFRRKKKATANHTVAAFYGCVRETLYAPFGFGQCAIYLPVIRNYIELQGTAFYIHRIMLFICCKILSAFSLVILVVVLPAVLPSSSSAMRGASINNR